MRFVAPGHSLVQEVTVREHVFWDIGCDVSLIESRPIQWARVFYSSWARSVKASHLKALSVPDSRGIDSGPFNDLRLEAVLSEVLAEATQNP